MRLTGRDQVELGALEVAPLGERKKMAKKIHATEVNGRGCDIASPRLFDVAELKTMFVFGIACGVQNVCDC